MDGVELEGLEWKPTEDKKGEITGYTWAGYNRDGSTVSGTVSAALVYNKAKQFTVIYSSNSMDKTGQVEFLSANSKEPYSRGSEVADNTTKNPYNVTINYEDKWVTISSLFGSYRKEVTVSTEIWNDQGSAVGEFTTFNKNAGVNPAIYNNPTSFFNSFRYSQGYADYPTSGALKPVYPESLLLPVPKGLNFLSKTYKTATGGTKQWLRVGASYSIEGKFKTYSLRWGASPRYLNKIKNLTLRQWNKDLRSWKIPYKSWRTADPGHLHFWKLKE